MMQPVGILAAGPGGAIFSSSAAMVLLVACLCSAPAAVIGWFRRLLAFPLWVLHAGADSFEKHHNFEQAPALLSQPPAQGPLKRLTVVLDLDETLVSSHLTSSLPDNLRDQAIEAGVKCCDIDFASLDKRFGGMQIVRFTIFERPGLQEFLRQISDFADIIVFTAGNEDYARHVLDKIDVDSKIKHRLYRSATVSTKYKRHVKDLSCISKDLSRIVIVDNRPSSFLLQPLNGIPCVPFTARDVHDKQLVNVILPLLRRLSLVKDVRPVLYEQFRMPEWFEKKGIP